MKFLLLVLVTCTSILATNNQSDILALRNCSWVWTSKTKKVAPGASYFRKVISLPKNADISKAVVCITADNENSIYINGKFCGSNAEWQVTSIYDIKSQLQPAENVVCIKVINEGPKPGPAGLIGKVLVLDKSGELLEFPIDNTWKCSKSFFKDWKKKDFNDSNWKNATVLFKYGGQPWGLFDLANNLDTQFPRFIVPGFDKEMELLEELFALHYSVPLLGTFNAHWVTESTLWPAVNPLEDNPKHIFYKDALSERRISDKGYISCHQHFGFGHPEGWPFPIWPQSKGIGWHFAKPTPFDLPPITTTNDWKLTGAKTIGFDENTGWELALTKPNAFIQVPAFEADNMVAAYIRFDWTTETLDKKAKPYIEWTSKTYPNFSEKRRVSFEPITSKTKVQSWIPLLNNPLWKTNDTLTGLRINFNNSGKSTINLHAIFTAVDTRHNVNNMIFIDACSSLINWTGDKDFLTNNIEKMRKAMVYMLDEFQVLSNKCVLTPWFGHDGRSGLLVNEKGEKTVLPGVGVGNGYWDLMPFGHKDTLATMFLYNALNKLADLEEQIEKNPELKIPDSENKFSPKFLRKVAKELKDNSSQFWNKETERFGSAIDIDGKLHDYGFTFLNLEAVHYDFANEEQSTKIIDWISGKRIVTNDTSKGEDIYHWRFAPRATTLRNIDYYGYTWSAPETIPFGYQIQDGGAVLGFSYHDLMARLKTIGPDDTWERLKKIIDWFGEVQAEGGYRKYYANNPKRGTLQGGGPPGGLGMDAEFFESVLLPQVMIYGFMGFQPNPEGFSINPNLPTNWPSLTITKIRLHDFSMNIKVSDSEIEIDVKDDKSANSNKTKFFPPKGKWNVAYVDCGGGTISQFNLEIKSKKDSIPLKKFKDSKKIILRKISDKVFSNKGGLIKDCADPSVMLHDGVYYLYCTADRFGGKDGVPVYKSTDLVNWEGPCGNSTNGLALYKDDVWGDRLFWAGDVIERNGKFYIYATVDEHLVAAVSDSPLGPFKQKIKKPMHDFREIDSGIFTDDDGKTYIYFVRFDRANVIFGAELSDDFLSMKEETITECFRPEQPWEFGPNEPQAKVNEGGFMLKHNGLYYLTYTANHFASKDYAIGYAISKTPLGPWKKYEGNPILNASDKVNGPGNGMFVKSPDGSETILVYHIHKDLNNIGPRALAIDRAYFKKNPKGGADILVIEGPSVDEQPFPSKK